MTNSTFGEKLKQLRKSQNKSQIEVVNEMEAEFGNVIRISQTTMSALEQRSTAPRGDVLEILAQYFGVPITYFFDADNDQSDRTTRAKTYLDSLKDRTAKSDDIRLHSNNNSSGDSEVIDSLNNIFLWQPKFDEDEYLEQ